MKEYKYVKLKFCCYMLCPNNHGGRCQIYLGVACPNNLQVCCHLVGHLLVNLVARLMGRLVGPLKCCSISCWLGHLLVRCWPFTGLFVLDKNKLF